VVHVPKNAYNNSNRFMILELKGPILPGVLGGPVDSLEDADMAAFTTCHFSVLEGGCGGG
jgi:hypothetical protein